jgi:hypothetical protein
VGTSAVAVSDGRRTVRVPVTVAPTPGAVLGVEVEPPAITLVTAATWRLAGRARTRDTSVSPALRFATLDSGVATVDATGLVRATGPGTATVVAAAAADPAVRAAVEVTVNRGSELVQSIFIVPFAAVLRVGDTLRFAGVISLAETAPPGTSRAATFTSDDTAVVRVLEGGLVRARRAGTAILEGAPVAAPALRATAAITVREPVP